MALTIGKYIHAALSTNADITEATDGNIFPVVCPDVDNTPTPYIIYWDEGVSESGSKDCIDTDTVSAKIMVVAKDYDALMDVLPTVRKAMAAEWTAWNSQDERPFTITDQTMHYDGENYDLEFGYMVGQFTYTIETEDNNE